MRFRITKNSDGSVYSIIVSGEIDDDAGWDVLQIAQVMLNMSTCRELIVDVRGAVIDDELSVFNTDTMVSVFEEGLLRKDSALTVRFRDESELRLCSDQLPLAVPQGYVDVSMNEAKFFGRAMKWVEQEARFMMH